MTYEVWAKKPRGKWRKESRHMTLAAAKKAADRLAETHNVTIHDTSGRRKGMSWARGDDVLPKRSAPKRASARKPAKKTSKRKPARKKSAIRRIKRWL